MKEFLDDCLESLRELQLHGGNSCWKRPPSVGMLKERNLKLIIL